MSRQRPRWLFVCDERRGHERSAKDWKALVEAMLGRGLEGIGIAHGKPFGLDHIEHCDMCARQAGPEARAVADAGPAERWLR